jgi:hypothetical protein
VLPRKGGHKMVELFPSMQLFLIYWFHISSSADRGRRPYAVREGTVQTGRSSIRPFICHLIVGSRKNEPKPLSKRQERSSKAAKQFSSSNGSLSKSRRSSDRYMRIPIPQG